MFGSSKDSAMYLSGRVARGWSRFDDSVVDHRLELPAHAAAGMPYLRDAQVANAVPQIKHWTRPMASSGTFTGSLGWHGGSTMTMSFEVPPLFRTSTVRGRGREEGVRVPAPYPEESSSERCRWSVTASRRRRWPASW